MNLSVLRTRSDEPVPTAGSQVITVFSPKGGVGKTFMAVSIAVTVAKRGRRKVLLCDMDLDSGDVGVHLDLAESVSINDLLPYCQDMRPEVMAKFVVRHAASGVDVIMAPSRPELSEFVRADVVGHLIDGARRTYQCIVIDTPPSADCDLVYECLEKSDTQLLVVTQDLACLRQARTSLELLRRLGVNVKERTYTVVNAYRHKSILSARKISDFLGVGDVLIVTDDRDTVERSILDGSPAVLGARGTQVSKDAETAGSVAANLLLEPTQEPKSRFRLPGKGRLRW